MCWGDPEIERCHSSSNQSCEVSLIASTGASTSVVNACEQVSCRKEIPCLQWGRANVPTILQDFKKTGLSWIMTRGNKLYKIKANYFSSVHHHYHKNHTKFLTRFWCCHLWMMWCLLSPLSLWASLDNISCGRVHLKSQGILITLFGKHLVCFEEHSQLK